MVEAASGRDKAVGPVVNSQFAGSMCRVPRQEFISVMMCAAVERARPSRS